MWGNPMNSKQLLWTGFLLLVLCTFCFIQPLAAAATGGKMMKIESSEFSEGGMIPSKYTCDGNDFSPPLTWKDAPAGTKSFALISDDPDAPMGTWVHWVIFNIPATINRLEENIPPHKELANGMIQGSNSWPRIGYGGPCPPGGLHRYFFKLYALDTKLELKPGVDKEHLIRAMAGHILAEAQVMGKYKRQR
jgi:Raf kinase inhibitor-like YbhB/YbcL family protein